MKIRVVRIHLATQVAVDENGNSYSSDTVLDGLAHGGFKRHLSTVVTPDGEYAVVTLAKDSD